MWNLWFPSMIPYVLSALQTRDRSSLPRAHHVEKVLEPVLIQSFAEVNPLGDQLLLDRRRPRLFSFLRHSNPPVKSSAPMFPDPNTSALTPQLPRDRSPARTTATSSRPVLVILLRLAPTPRRASRCRGCRSLSVSFAPWPPRSSLGSRPRVEDPTPHSISQSPRGSGLGNQCSLKRSSWKSSRPPVG